jgi:hypothetical protein
MVSEPNLQHTCVLPVIIAPGIDMSDMEVLPFPNTRCAVGQNGYLCYEDRKRGQTAKVIINGWSCLVFVLEEEEKESHYMDPRLAFTSG